MTTVIPIDMLYCFRDGEVTVLGKLDMHALIQLPEGAQLGEVYSHRWGHGLLAIKIGTRIIIYDDEVGEFPMQDNEDIGEFRPFVE